MKILPSKSQWKLWSLPGKASYLGCCFSILGLLLSILIPFVKNLVGGKRDIPVVSILSIDTLLHEDSMETKFVVKNTSKMNVFFKVKFEANIGNEPVSIQNIDMENQSQILTPDQVIKYRGLTINGDTYKRILNGDFNERIT